MKSSYGLMLFALTLLTTSAWGDPPVFPAEGSTVVAASRGVAKVIVGTGGITCPGTDPSFKGVCEVKPANSQWFKCQAKGCDGFWYTVAIYYYTPPVTFQNSCGNFLRACANMVSRATMITDSTILVQPGGGMNCVLPVVMVRTTRPAVPAGPGGIPRAVPARPWPAVKPWGCGTPADVTNGTCDEDSPGSDREIRLVNS